MNYVIHIKTENGWQQVLRSDDCALGFSGSIKWERDPAQRDPGRWSPRVPRTSAIILATVLEGCHHWLRNEQRPESDST